MRSKAKHVGTLGLLLLLGALSARADANSTRLIDAVRSGNQAEVRSQLKQHSDKAYVNAADAEGMTALNWATYRDDLAATQLLLDAGAAVKTANRLGDTPLHNACTFDDVPLIGVLLKAGADEAESRPDRLGKSPS